MVTGPNIPFGVAINFDDHEEAKRVRNPVPGTKLTGTKNKLRRTSAISSAAISACESRPTESIYQEPRHTRQKQRGGPAKWPKLKRAYGKQQ